MERSDKKRTTAVILALLVLGFVITALVFSLSRGGSSVSVSVDGREVESFPLSRDLTFDITGYGGGHNLLVIKDGSAYIESASCPDGLCVNMGRISRAGQSVICLPNRVVVEIK